MSWLYVGLLSIPFLSIISRVIYVQTNKNAYQSYSGQTSYNINYKYVSDNLEDGPIIGHIYQLNLNNEDLTDTNFEMDFILISGFIDLNGRLEINDGYIDDFEIYPNISYGLYENNLNYTNINYFSVHFETILCNNAVIELLYCNGIAEQYLSYTDYNEIANVEINNNGTLDNVFTYSVNEIIKENNFGNIDFFQWFTDMFLTDNQVNKMYVGFANWYFNYVLMASCGYLLFLVLMWFINYSRRLLERGMNYDW